jgi:hypothetical protein
MAVSSTKLGPGTLILGETGTTQDASCQMTGAVVAWDKDKADDITVLCGDVVAGGTTYTATLSGTFLQDLAEDDGLVAFTWANKGVETKFVYVPNTVAAATVTGVVVIDPIDVGSTDDYGSTMTSDFEWDCVGEPVLTFGSGTAVEDVGAELAEPVR